MNELLKEKCELLADNHEIVRKEFKWDYDMMSVVAGSIFSSAGQKANPEKMKICREILKKHSKAFSNFRSTVELAVISKMAVSNNPENYLEEVMGVYEKIKGKKIFTSEYMVLAAMCICDQHKVGQAEEVVEKANKILKKMEAKHPLLTGSEDTSYATLLAMTDRSVDEITEDIEKCFTILKEKFTFHKNAVQGLSMVLALKGDDAKSKCERILQIYQALKDQNVKWGKETELVALASLLDIDMDVKKLADEIADASAYLKKRKGFGDWAMGKEYRAMFAALITSEVYSDEASAVNSSLLGSSLGIIIAEQVAVMLIVTSSAAATAASN